MSEYYKFVYDENELKWFWTWCIPKLKQDELFFCSLSARNKALDEEERKIYKLSRSEMFAKTLIRHDSWEIFSENIYRFETNKKGFTTKAGFSYPDKCLTVYWNINPANVRKVINAQQLLILELQDELINGALKKSSAAIDEAFHKMRKVFDSTISLYARNFGTKYWFDIDIDLPKDMINNHVETVHVELVKKLGAGNFFMINTKGGMHIIFRKKILKFNPQDLITLLTEIFFYQKTIPDNIDGEIIVNKNFMIPLPGTLQCGWPVTVFNKDDTATLTSFKDEAE